MGAGRFNLGPPVGQEAYYLSIGKLVLHKNITILYGIIIYYIFRFLILMHQSESSILPFVLVEKELVYLLYIQLDRLVQWFRTIESKGSQDYMRSCKAININKY